VSLKSAHPAFSRRLGDSAVADGAIISA